MPKHAYVQRNLGPEKLRVIKMANAIITEYEGQGFDLTLRQLYYQFVARGLLDNKPEEYKRLGDIINDGRLCGLIDWLAIVDRTRNLKSLGHWSSPEDIVLAVSEQYHVDMWATQPRRVEVWIEKDALVGVIDGVCKELDVPYFSCRGYTSQSEMWVASQRLLRYVEKGQEPLILHFGDHDPSGKDMTRDIIDRLTLFMGDDMQVSRLALNIEQIEKYHPPPNPAKISDSRAKAYIAEFGDESWELDALEPAVLAGLIRDTIVGLQDGDAWQEKQEEQDTAREELAAISVRYDDVQKYLNKKRGNRDE